MTWHTLIQFTKSLEVITTFRWNSSDYVRLQEAFHRAFHKDYIEALQIYIQISRITQEYHRTSTSKRVLGTRY